MKRVGVAFYGLPRGHLVTQPVLQQFLDTLRQEFEVCPRYHLYRVQELSNPRSGEQALMSAEAYHWFASMPGEIVSPAEVPAHWMEERLSQAGDVQHDGQRSARNLLLQLHSLRAVTKALIQDEPDVVLFMRPDLLYHQPPDAALVRRALAQPRLCLLPAWQWWGGMNDRFAICGRAAYRHYGLRADEILAFLGRNPGHLHAEALLRDVLFGARLKVRLIANRASRVREADRIVEENFDVKKTLGVGWKQSVLHQVLSGLRDDWPWP